MGTVNTPKVIIIVGPTASGKTGYAITLAKEFHGEVIAADSRTTYRGMDIGTAKPARDRVAFPKLAGQEVRGRGEDWPYLVDGISHHLIDTRNPNEAYSVAEFKRDAERVIGEITERGHVPIIVGGTGLYVQALVEDFEIPEIGASSKLREAFEQKSNGELLALLQAFDPVSATRVDAKNKRRLIRALEVCVFTGRPFSELRRRSNRPRYEFLEIGIDMPREQLYQRIDARTAQFFTQGILNEVHRLVFRYGPRIEAFRGVIYRQIIHALTEHADLGRMEDDPRVADLIVHINSALHAYARRQIAWFKRDSKIKWVKTEEEAKEIAREFLKE